MSIIMRTDIIRRKQPFLFLTGALLLDNPNCLVISQSTSFHVSVGGLDCKIHKRLWKIRPRLNYIKQNSTLPSWSSIRLLQDVFQHPDGTHDFGRKDSGMEEEEPEYAMHLVIAAEENETGEIDKAVAYRQARYPFAEYGDTWASLHDRYEDEI